jgi:DDE superfamily endonuclease
MMLRHGSTPDLVDQEASVVPGGAAYLHDLERRLAPYVERTEPRQRAIASLRGLLSPAERKTSWQWAASSGDATPAAVQHLRRRALWDPEAVRSELRSYIGQHLGDAEAVLVLDETGFLKKGRHSAGVARQSRGTAGKVDNCQIGVLLGYASPLGHALLDRALYLPAEWTDDRERWRQAGIPDAQRFATKPQLAQQLLAGRWRLACPPAGSRAAASMAMIAACDCGWRLSPKPMSWRFPVRSTSGWTGDNARSSRSWPPCRRRVGCGSGRETGAKGPAGMPGVGCRWPSRWSRPGAAGGWSGGVSVRPRR